jgi:hypothetical protein
MLQMAYAQLCDVHITLVDVRRRALGHELVQPVCRTRMSEHEGDNLAAESLVHYPQDMYLCHACQQARQLVQSCEYLCGLTCGRCR